MVHDHNIRKLRLEPDGQISWTKSAIEVKKMMIMTPEIDDSAIAIVGMAGRFPGANCIGALWDLI
jgi:hypothetical protein